MNRVSVSVRVSDLVLALAHHLSKKRRHSFKFVVQGVNCFCILSDGPFFAVCPGPGGGRGGGGRQGGGRGSKGFGLGAPRRT